MISDMQLVFLILIATTVCFAIPKFRSDLVALCSLLALFLTGHAVNIDTDLADINRDGRISPVDLVLLAQMIN